MLSFLTANVMPSVRFFFAVFSAFLLFFRVIYRRAKVTWHWLHLINFSRSPSFELISALRNINTLVLFENRLALASTCVFFFVNKRCLQPVRIYNRAHGILTLMVVQLSVSLLRGPTCKSCYRPVFSLWKLLKLRNLFVFFFFLTWDFLSQPRRYQRLQSVVFLQTLKVFFA